MKAAIVQHAPTVLDREQSIADAVRLVAEAADLGARLAVFPEAFVPGYPAWIWRLRPGSDWGLNKALHARLVDNAVTVEGDDLMPLRNAAKEHDMTVVCGIHERDDAFSRATLYNTVVTIGPDGTLLNRHRKLMPTNPERMVWGLGDASGLKVVDSACGRIGSLICWENYMPLSRYALYAQGVEVYIAPTYDCGEGWIGTLQHIAREGGCWVLGSGCVLRATDIPDDLPGRETLYPDADEWVNPGDSVIIAPGGKIIVPPLHNEEGILVAEIDLSWVVEARRTLDVAGHYARPDLFSLEVDNRTLKPFVFGDGNPQE
jgi:nitrilase